MKASGICNIILVIGILFLILSMVGLFSKQLKECKEYNGILVKGISGWGTGYVCIDRKSLKGK